MKKYVFAIIVFLIIGAIGVISQKDLNDERISYYEAEEDFASDEEPTAETRSATWPENGINYNVNKEISSRLNCEEFDREFKAFLIDSGVCDKDSFSYKGKTMQLVNVKDNGRLTFNLDSGAIMFELQIEREPDRPSVSCVVYKNEYSFEVVGE